MAMDSGAGHLVSVLMPAFNAESSIEKAICSVLNQTYKNIELVIVNDGSTDGTLEIISSFVDSRIKLINFSVNRGRGYARTECLRSSNGTYVTMLDADDWMYFDRVEKQVEFFQNNPSYSIHSFAMAAQSRDGLLIGVRGTDESYVGTRYRRFKGAHASSMFCSRDVGDLDYRKCLKQAQDIDFLTRLSVGKKVALTSTVKYVYTEESTISVKKLVKGYLYSALSYTLMAKDTKLATLFHAFFEILKIPYSTLKYFILGQSSFVKARNRSASELEKEEFLKNRDRLYELLSHRVSSAEGER